MIPIQNLSAQIDRIHPGLKPIDNLSKDLWTERLQGKLPISLSASSPKSSISHHPAPDKPLISSGRCLPSMVYLLPGGAHKSRDLCCLAVSSEKCENSGNRVLDPGRD